MAGNEQEGPARRTRAEQREETRRHLVLSALANFTRDGYHGANLDTIAADAGYSKGAVYSNFAGKAELFLAVLDHNIAFGDIDGWDPLEHPGRHGLEDPPSPLAGHVSEHLEDEPTPEEAAQAFGLATLEFVGTAARDPELRAAIGQRFDVLVGAYSRYVAGRRAPTEALTDREIGLLLGALDQGAAVLALGGTTVEPQVLRAGLHRLMDPLAASAPDMAGGTGGRAAAEADWRADDRSTAGPPDEAPHDFPVWNDLDRVRALLAEVRVLDQRMRAQRDEADRSSPS